MLDTNQKRAIRLIPKPKLTNSLPHLSNRHEKKKSVGFFILMEMILIENRMFWQPISS